MEENSLQSMLKTAFISGPVEYPDDYFHLHYTPLLDKAIELKHSFVLGPAPGIDTEVLKYLIEKGVDPSAITVYMAEFEECVLKERVQWFLDLGGNLKVEGVTCGERDAVMTRESDYDILRYMPVEEQKVFFGQRYFPRVSATEKNERRRKGLPLHVNHAFAEWEAEQQARKKGLEGTSSTNWKTGLRGLFKKRPSSKQ